MDWASALTCHLQRGYLATVYGGRLVSVVLRNALVVSVVVDSSVAENEASVELTQDVDARAVAKESAVLEPNDGRERSSNYTAAQHKGAVSKNGGILWTREYNGRHLEESPLN